MKNSLCVLLFLCSLSVFSQEAENSERYYEVTLDGEVAYIDVTTGDIVSRKPNGTVAATPTASATIPTQTAVVNTANSVTGAHVVAKGETLYAISRKYNTSINELKALNPSISFSTLSIGQIINVKKSSNDTFDATYIDEPTTNSASTMVSSNSYVVKKGETLYAISRMFNTSVHNLKRLNNLTSNVISVGQKLIVK